MDCFIQEYTNSLTEYLCDDIIDKFLHFKEQNDYFDIIKNDDTWKKIETLIYKETLIKINVYKNKIISVIPDDDIIADLNKPLFTRKFTIYQIKDKFDEKIRINSRSNVVSYLFFLNDCECGEFIFNVHNKPITIKPAKGKMLIFPDTNDFKFKYNPPINTCQFIIFGQLTTNNIF